MLASMNTPTPSENIGTIIEPLMMFMQSLTGTPNRKTIVWAVILIAVWLVLWFTPWQSLSVLSLWLKLGLALVLFIVPGFCLYGLVQDAPSGWLSHLTFGFVISHLILAVFGTLGRFLHFPFDLLKHGMMALGLILLLTYVIPRLDSFKLPRFEISTLRKLASTWPLVLMVVLAGLMTIQRVISDDDLSYLAFLTHWQHSPALNFNDAFFGADELASVRFWIVSTPFSQALLAELSEIPGIFLLGGYYEPFLAALSLFSIYELAKTLGLSRPKAMAAVVFQVVFLSLLAEYLHPGAPFFLQLSTDKATAAYIFTPVFLHGVVGYLRQPVKKNIILMTLTGLSLMMMHPVALVFAVMVAGLMGIFGLNRSTLRSRMILFILMVLIMASQIAVRFVKHEAQGVIPYSIQDAGGTGSMISFWGDTPFYGYNPDILAMHIPYSEKIPIPPFILQYAWLVIPLSAAVFAVQQIRHDFLSQYVMASFLLGALAGIPFTGWLLGYFVSAWMLVRTLMVYPFGIGMVFLLIAMDNSTGLTSWMQARIRPIPSRTHFDLQDRLLASLTVFSTVLILLVMREQNLPNSTRFASNAERYREFTQIGKFMDDRTFVQSFAAGTDQLNNYIPGIASKVKVISFRPSDPSYPYFYSEEERNQRLTDRQSIFSREVDIHARLALIRKYEIRFLWVKGSEYYKVKKLASSFPAIFSVHKIGRYYLIEVH